MPSVHVGSWTLGTTLSSRMSWMLKRRHHRLWLWGRRLQFALSVPPCFRRWSHTILDLLSCISCRRDRTKRLLQGPAGTRYASAAPMHNLKPQRGWAGPVSGCADLSVWGYGIADWGSPTHGVPPLWCGHPQDCPDCQSAQTIHPATLPFLFNAPVRLQSTKPSHWLLYFQES